MKLRYGPIGSVAVLATALSGCRALSPVAPSPPPSGNSVLTMDAAQWTFQYSPNMPVHPIAAANGWQFTFPYLDGVHYLTTRQGPTSASQFIAASIRVETSGNPFFEYRTDPNNVCDAPSTGRLYFQRRGDTGSAQGDYEFYRWWGNHAGFVLNAGHIDLFGDLTDPSQWTSVYGRSGDTNEPMFRAALADIGAVGLTFGGGCFYGHGVFVAPDSGQATFSATSYVVR